MDYEEARMPGNRVGLQYKFRPSAVDDGEEEADVVGFVDGERRKRIDD
jgi:hypothetical protein